VTDVQAAESFTEFVRDVEPGLKHALVAGFGTEVGMEATRDALAVGWERWDEVREKANPAGYLFGVGRNKARRRLRRHTVFPVPTADHDPWVEPALPGALRRLSERQRVAVMLLHGYDWTHAEVADLMGVSLSTVQQHEARGMAKLRRAIGVGDER
jgi:DNA-directed RNA polymerase specialized sigma24 family protein